MAATRPAVRETCRLVQMASKPAIEAKCCMVGVLSMPTSLVTAPRAITP